MDESAIHLERIPALRMPVLFAAWPGMGNVALNAAQYLVDTLQMEPLGSIESTEFSFAEGIIVRDHIILPLQIPEYRFYLFQGEAAQSDLIVFLADNQPVHPQGYLLARLVMQVARTLGVQRIYTGAALACSISHMDSPRVWGVATARDLLGELESGGIHLLSEGHISGLNGLLLGVGKKMGLDGVCLLGELPYYTIGIDNPKSSLSILERFSSLWGIPIDMTALHEESLKKEMEIEEFIRQGEKKGFVEEMMRRGDADTETPQ